MSKTILTFVLGCDKLINVAATGKRESTEQQQKMKKLLTNDDRCDNISFVVKTTGYFGKHLIKENKKVLDK